MTSQQVVIYRKEDKKFLKRKSSYGVTTWTTDLQEAKTWTPKGAEMAIKAMDGETYDQGELKKIECGVTPVSLRLEKA